MGEVANERGFNRSFMRANPRNFPSENALKFEQLRDGKAEYKLLKNNCHSHAQAVLKELGF